jgi:hypothetical protein
MPVTARRRARPGGGDRPGGRRTPGLRRCVISTLPAEKSQWLRTDLRRTSAYFDMCDPRIEKLKSSGATTSEHRVDFGAMVDERRDGEAEGILVQSL